MIKPYPKNKEYLVSDSGIIFRVVKLKLQKHDRGYLKVRITNKKSGKRENLYVHRIVAETFTGKNLKTLQQVNHLDYNKINNNLDNLEITNALENIIHRDLKKETPF